MVVDVYINTSVAIRRSTTKDTMTFWYNALISVERCFETDWTGMQFCVCLVEVDDTFEASACDHGSSVDQGTNIIDIIILPVICISGVAW